MDTYTKNAINAVVRAVTEPGWWNGDGKHNEQVYFGNAVYTVAYNGDSADFLDPSDAVQALVNEWRSEDDNRDE